jgi:hypothetical protein
MLLGVVDEFLPNWAVEDLEAKKIRLVYEVYTEQYENPALGVYLEGVDEDTGRGSFQLLCRSKGAFQTQDLDSINLLLHPSSSE